MTKSALKLVLVTIAFFAVTNAAHQPTVTIQKPKTRTVTGGGCRLTTAGTFAGTWGPSALPTLAFTIGPQSAMADQMHANKAKFTGPGSYKNEIIAVYLGKTALQDSYGGLGTVTINADGHTEKFEFNDGSAAGHFDCGVPPVKS